MWLGNNEINEGNVAATLLKVQEKKTQKGNSYAIIKLTDLTSVFELFIFSDVLELNREILKEGSSLILTLIKNISNEQTEEKSLTAEKIANKVLNDDNEINKISKDQIKNTTQTKPELSSLKLGEAIYKQNPQAGAAQPDPSGEEPSSDKKDEKVVDAEFEEVDENKKD